MRRLIKRFFKSHRTSTFWKFLLSYLIMFLLPTMLILAYFYPKLSQISTNKAYGNLKAEIYQYKQNLDIQFETIIQYSDIFNRNKHIKLNILKSDNEFDNYLIKQELKTMTGGNIFIKDIFFYNKFTNRFISKNSNFTMDEFNNDNNLYTYVNWERNDMFNLLDNIRDIEIRPIDKIISQTTGSYRGITVLVPVPYPNLNPYGVFVATITEKQLFSHINDSSFENKNLVIANKKGEVIASYIQDEYLTNKKFIDILKSDKIEFTSKTISKEEYIIYQQSSSVGEYKYLYIAPLKDVLAELNTVIKNIIIIAVSLFCIGLLLVGWFMYINYKPIHKLREKLFNGSINKLQKDDVIFINDAINEIKRQNEDLFEKVILNKSIITEHFLITLINGNFENKEEIMNQAEKRGVILKDNICCITFGSAKRNIALVLDAINKLINSLSEDVSSHYLIKGLQHEDFTIILSFFEEREIKPFIYKLYDMQEDICVGIGSNEELVNANRSYTLSLAALEYGLHHQEFPVTCYSDMEYEDYSDMKYVMNQLENLELSIDKKNPDILQSNLQNIIKFLQKDQMRNVLKKTIYISTFNILVKGLRENYVDYDYIYALPQIEVKSDIMNEKIIKMAKEISNIFEKCNKDKIITADKIIEYIDKHYCDADISLESVSEQFSLSYSNCSHYLKNNIGITFTEYLREKRIEKSKEILLNDNCNIEKIAYLVGYNSISSFNRAFKKVTGVSPKRFKKNKSKNK